VRDQPAEAAAAAAAATLIALRRYLH